jgi:hypothetical protein
LSIGHDEYWTWEMRRHVEAARDAGVHLGFFSANSAYWQVRLEPSAASGTTDRIMVCHKKAARDPDVHRATDKWRRAAVDRPEEQLIGVMYAGDPVDADIVVAAGSHWVFADTGLASGDALPGLLGYEVDAVHGCDLAGGRPHEPVHGGQRRPGLRDRLDPVGLGARRLQRARLADIARERRGTAGDAQRARPLPVAAPAAHMTKPSWQVPVLLPLSV